MKLLVLGGTKFLGRQLVRAALAAGHEVTLFNRGATNPELFPAVERLHGDREGDLSALAGRRWDAAIDVPGWSERLIDALRGSVDHYTFVSSISVYADMSRPVTEETTTLDDDEYGGTKARLEAAAQAAFPEALVVRPGLIVGPHDPTGRFTYWAHRSGQVLAPEPCAQPVQLIDVRDLAEWVLRSVEAGLTGVFNATGPREPLTLAEVLAACSVEPIWVDSDFLLERDVEPWSGLPLWLPAADWRGMLQADISRALAAGLTFRPLAETIAATRAEAVPGPAGLAPEREQALLEEWSRR